MPGRRSADTMRAVLLLGLLLAPLAVGCSDSGQDGASCGPIRRETLDPKFLIHVLPGATGLRYRTDPPTSGPHQPAPRLARVQSRPLPRPVQVGVLEGGDVLVQYRGLSRGDVDRLERLAGDRVVVAPNPTLPRRVQVVATGWVHKRTCDGVNTGAIEEFIKQRAGKGPDTP